MIGNGAESRGVSTMKNRHKILSFMLAAALAIPGGITSADAASLTAGFDSGTDGWLGRGGAAVSADRENYYDGGGSLLVTRRGDNWHGAAVSLPGAEFPAGSSHSFSAAVLQKSGSDVQIKMSLQYNSGGREVYSEIALVKAVSGVWTDISNADYTIPDGAENLMLYIESPDSLTDLYIDSFTAAEKGTPSAVVTGRGVVDGTAVPGAVSGTITGDLSGDGKLSVFDLVLARQFMIDRFSGSASVDLSAADIDGDGDFSMNDVVLLAKFLHGQVKEFPEKTVQTTAATVPPAITTTTVPSSEVSSGGFMEKIANDMQISAPGGFTQLRAGVDYGTMEHKSYFSKDGGIKKNINVLLPPGYNSSEKYPVLYVLHGIFGDENSMPGMGIQTMIGNLVADGEAEKMIIVFPAMFTGTGSPGFDSESARKYDLIREDIENSIMPFMEENYSVKTGRENTAITGFSMGGREALYTGVTRSEVYGYVGAACPAPGIFATKDDFMTHEGCLTESQFKPAAAPELLLISAAAFDGTVGDYPQSYHEALARNGADHLWQVIPNGDHGPATVTPHMYNFLRYVFKA